MSKTFVIASAQQKDPPTELSLRLDPDGDVEIVATNGSIGVALGYFSPQGGKFVRSAFAPEKAEALGFVLDERNLIVCA